MHTTYRASRQASKAPSFVGDHICSSSRNSMTFPNLLLKQSPDVIFISHFRVCLPMYVRNRKKKHTTFIERELFPIITLSNNHSLLHKERKNMSLGSHSFSLTLVSLACILWNLKVQDLASHSHLRRLQRTVNGVWLLHRKSRYHVPTPMLCHIRSCRTEGESMWVHESCYGQ